MAKKKSLIDKANVAVGLLAGLAIAIPEDDAKGAIEGWVGVYDASYTLRQAGLLEGRDQQIRLSRVQGKALAEHLTDIFL